MQRRVTGLTAAVAALGITAGVTGCGATGGSGDVTLKMVAADYGDGPANSSQKYWDAVAADFEKQNPGIKVDVDVYSWSDVDAKVAAMVKKGAAPDIAQIGAYSDYAAQGKLYRAGDLLSIPVQADFLPALTEAGQVRRVQYGMPFASSTRLLFYNKKLFAEAGITDAPQSWTELATDARLLKAKGVKYPFALPLGSEEAPAETLMWLLSGGDGYTDNVGTYTLDSDLNVQTFKWLKDELVGKDLTGPTAPGELDRQDAFNAFSRGEVGMLNGHPTLMKQAEKKGVEYGMVPLPGVNGNAKSTLGVADWMMGFKRHGHKEEIGKFLDFVYDDANVLEFSERYDILPVTSTASDKMAEDPEYKHLRKFLEELPDSQLYPVGKTSWAQVSASLKKNIGKAVRPDGNPASVLRHLQNEAAAAESAE
ncbi:ABC transporter substrate-binding protein [Streptomyces boluensis]|uniref:Extracellular solute-binding protein n=1 Tax=Streptomyces boluensis TaxID=1775135 RepID=A0A964UUU4_9ACTN|nr:extracellular solute-binding protein [Streptomyces boluensis]NBE54613.1 extracellular solute-binding protein [Streptomyces boluensis]